MIKFYQRIDSIDVIEITQLLFAAPRTGWYKDSMQIEEFRALLGLEAPPEDLPVTLAALWWDAKGDWVRAHHMVDSLETQEGMAVHAYLHRKEGAEWNADYWYQRAGRRFHRPAIDEEWEALVEGLPSR
jgi:hypothetical protein